MSIYGLRIWDSIGSLILDINARLTRHRYSNEVSSDGNTTLSDIDGLTTVELTTMINPSIDTGLTSTYLQTGYVISRSGTTISWASGIGSVFSIVNSLISVFFYV